MNSDELERINSLLDRDVDLREVTLLFISRARWAIPTSISESKRTSQWTRQKGQNYGRNFEQNPLYPIRCESVLKAFYVREVSIDYLWNCATVATLLDSVRPILLSCQDVFTSFADIIPANQFWRWKDMWANSLRTAVFAAALVEFLSTRKLLSLENSAQTLGSQWNIGQLRSVSLYSFSDQSRTSGVIV